MAELHVKGWNALSVRVYERVVNGALMISLEGSQIDPHSLRMKDTWVRLA